MCGTIWCWLIPALTGIICGILGYLLGKIISSRWQKKYNDLYINSEDYKKRILELENELKLCRDNKNTDIQSDLTNSKPNVANLKGDLVAKDKRIAELEEQLRLAKTAFIIPFDAVAAKAVFGKKIKQDDLKIVEGIGPKIEELFHNHGIKTWKALSETSVDKCQEVLNSGGESYKVHNPGTWPEQSKMAYEGKWKELLKWQDELDGGK